MFYDLPNLKKNSSGIWFLLIICLNWSFICLLPLKSVNFDYRYKTNQFRFINLTFFFFCHFLQTLSQNFKVRYFPDTLVSWDYLVFSWHLWIGQLLFLSINSIYFFHLTLTLYSEILYFSCAYTYILKGERLFIIIILIVQKQ